MSALHDRDDIADHPGSDPGPHLGDDALRDRVRALVPDVADFPEPGIVFRDITPLLADGAAFAAVVDALAGSATGIDVVAGIESRGFLLGAPVATRLGVGLVPVRKAGRLPRETLSASYALEYGEATLEVHVDAFAPGQRVLVVDDVLATGGTAAASIDLVRRAGAEPVAFSVLIELTALHGRERVSGPDVRALLRL